MKHKKNSMSLTFSFIASDLAPKGRIPSLETLAHIKSLENIVSFLAREDITGINEQLKSLPQNLRKVISSGIRETDPTFNHKFLLNDLQNLERSAFRNESSTVITKKIRDGFLKTNDSIPYPSFLLQRLRVLSDEELFKLWRIFFDENHDRKIEVKVGGAKFSMLLVTYLLQSSDNALEELAINYNWFLKTDFDKLLKRLKNRLKSLSIEASAGTESDALEIIANAGCKLEAFTFNRKTLDKGMRTNAIISFINSQNCLRDLNMSDWLRNVEEKKYILTLLFQKCTRLQKLSLLNTDLCNTEENLDLEYIDNQDLLAERNLTLIVKCVSHIIPFYNLVESRALKSC